ncbi:MAG: Transcriptional regulator, AcrR family [Firmicutes bacterium]|nr:Transcriptional regulator, AcrR family [Bacillota bacterium]
MQPELRKQELIEIAFRQFLQQGYEKTSIRSIVGEANGEIGMFYHHFASKEEIFKTVLEQYNIAYVKKIEHIISERKESSFWDLLEHILSDLESSLREYANMNQGAANTQVLMMLHQNTLISLRPIFCELIDDYIRRGEISPPETDTGLLTDFLLFGVSAVVHDNGEKSTEAKKEAIKALLCRLLGITPKR